jgi:hypothetical protein
VLKEIRMKLFEYKQITKVDYINEDELGQMGKEGWELILCDIGSYIFKREMTQLPTEESNEGEFDDYGMRVNP